MTTRDPARGTESIDFCGTRLVLVREEAVQSHLSLAQGLADLREVLATGAGEGLVCRPRVRIDSRERGHAWLHTLRAGLPGRGVAGGKDYTSIDFTTPAMWATVIDTRTGLPLAFVEADYLSRVRTAAVTALATDLLAPPEPACLAQIGAGKISRLLVEAVLLVRPSIRRVLLARRRPEEGAPGWLSDVGSGAETHLVDVEAAVAAAEVVTTATNSAVPVIPAGAALPRLRHLNLLGSNHLKRREIDLQLARRCLPPKGFLVTDDPEQAAAEAGDFAELAARGEFRWAEIPPLSRVAADPALRRKGALAGLTAFKSVGVGLMDLIVATGLLQRLGVIERTD